MAETTLSLFQGREVTLTRRTAFKDGTNIRKAMRLAPDRTRAWMVREVGRLIKFVDATKTISDHEELIETCRALIEEMPAMTLEEFALVFEGIKRDKFGPMYGRLKLGELLSCCRQWEGQRAEMILERDHRPDYDPNRRASDAVPLRKALHLTESDLLEIDRHQKKKTPNPGADD